MLAAHLQRSVMRLVAAKKGVAAIEFAIIFPFMLFLMMAGLQTITYINATRKVELVAAAISEMLSQTAPPTRASIATVNASDLHFAYDASLVVFPYLMQDGPRQGVTWWQDITIDFASIQFTQVQSNCTNPTDQSACYVANVVWTSVGTSGGNNRPCYIPQQAVDNTVQPSKTTLPRSVFGPGSLIAVDVVFNFKPTFGARFVPAITIARSIYVQPRYASIINYDLTNTDGIAAPCS